MLEAATGVLDGLAKPVARDLPKGAGEGLGKDTWEPFVNPQANCRDAVFALGLQWIDKL